MTGLYVVAYDIADDRRRLQVARVLEGYGQRVQYSVFECDLETRQYQQMLRRVGRALDPADSLRVYHVADALRGVVVLGGSPVFRAPGVIVA